MNARDRTGVLKILRAFFRVAGFVFLLVSFSFSVDETGKTWIMWRDATLLAVTLVAIALLMAGGWLYTARRLRRLPGGADQWGGAPRGPGRRAGGDHPYNIWGPMPAGTRVGLGLAVFLIFGTIGPLNGLLTPPTHALRPLDIVISTLGSGGISACIILFAHRRLYLVLSLAACLALLFNADSIATFFGAIPVPPASAQGEAVTLTQAQLDDIQGQRDVVAGAGIVLLSLGYVMFIFLLTGEGRQRSRLEAEVSIARGIQESLIPSGGITGEGAEAAGLTVPASEVGGDYYDFLLLPDGRLAVFAADVVGHGVGAGILAAMTKSAFRAHIDRDPSPVAMLTHLNLTLAQLVGKNMFITAAYVLFEPGGKRARVATAGHPPVLHLSQDGGVEEIRTPSLALGMGRMSAFQEVEFACAAGDLLVLYTDGLVESVDAAGTQFGAERLNGALPALRAEAPRRVCEALIEEAAAFRGSRPAADDVTVVAVKIR